MTSERARDEHGRWYIREDQYVKLTLKDDSTVFLGDIVATGVTVAAAFAKLFEQTSGLPRDRLPAEVADHLFFGLSDDHRQGLLAKSAPRPRIPLRRVVFFTIGCHKAEKVLEATDARLREAFPGYERTILVYLEGKFRLVDSRTPLRIGLPGTDLARWQALLAPEFERSQYDAPAFPLERCAVYDAGSRAFDVPAYVADVARYWEEVERLARTGWTLAEALLERWPDGAPADPAAFRADRAERWPGAPPAVVEEILALNAAFWRRGRESLTSDALLAVCRERLATLRAAGSPA
jgi:hypothetical protein